MTLLLPLPGEGAMLVCRPNGLRISCGRSGLRPHKPTFRSALQARCARAEAGAHSGPSAACAG